MSNAYSIGVSEEGGRKTLTFGGDLTINHIDKIVEEVRAKVGEPADTTVVVDNPGNIDMTFMQLTLSLGRTCREAGKQFEVKSTLKDDLAVLVRKAGLAKEFGL